MEGEEGRNEGECKARVIGKERKRKFGSADSARAQPLAHPRGAFSRTAKQGSMAALCPVRRRLFAALSRQPRRTYASATDSSERILRSQDDWTAFQLDRAERTTLG